MKLNSRGDTIVEVLIAVAVVGVVITGAYASARQSLNSVRASQERAEALKFAEGQMERLKYYAAKNSDATYTGTFCLSSTNPVTTLASPTNCKFGTDSRYTIGITKDASGVFNLTVTWPQITGSTGNLSLAYKAEI